MWHVLGQERCIQSLGGRTEKRDHLEDPGVDGKIILKWIFKTWGGKSWNGLIWLGIGAIGGRLSVW